jgi:hypothetical protein
MKCRGHQHHRHRVLIAAAAAAEASTVMVSIRQLVLAWNHHPQSHHVVPQIGKNLALLVEGLGSR